MVFPSLRSPVERPRREVDPERSARFRFLRMFHAVPTRSDHRTDTSAIEPDRAPREHAEG
jgi:hypothetical protein